MDSIPLILIGGGGHAVSVIEVIKSTEMYVITGVLDITEKIGQMISDIPILGDDNMIDNLISQDNSFIITLGQIKSASLRRNYFEQLQSKNATIATVTSSTTYKSNSAIFGIGNTFMHHTFINAGVNIGDNNIINTKVLIEHGVQIGSHCHISTGSIINGDCIIGDEVFLGSNSTVMQGVSICDNVVIAAGSVVNKSITRPGVYAGSPCRWIKN